MRFNPRTHEGCDKTCPEIKDLLSEFQSTHPRGVRLRIQQKAEYHDAKVIFLRETTKLKILKVHKGYRCV